jgi:hypothetical protein
MQGYERFRDHFAGYDERFVIIGGMAAHILGEEIGLAFRRRSSRASGRS